MIVDGGRNSQIHTDYGEIRVLSLDQVGRAYQELDGMELVDLALDYESDQMLEDLFPALQRFFSFASEAGEFVLVSHI
jgi:hypothetical protein